MNTQHPEFRKFLETFTLQPRLSGSNPLKKVVGKVAAAAAFILPKAVPGIEGQVASKAAEKV